MKHLTHPLLTTLRIHVGTVIVVLALGTIAALAEAPAKKQGYESYRMMRTRNIFDPDRKANEPARTARPSTPAPAASDYVALTGILMDCEKILAFFSGSRPEYNRVLAVNAEIAGATIKIITPAGIEVERAGKRITVAVGQTVPGEGAMPTAAPVSASTGSASSNTAPSLNTAPSPDKEALLRRMMERRQNELK